MLQTLVDVLCDKILKRILVHDSVIVTISVSRGRGKLFARRQIVKTLDQLSRSAIDKELVKFWNNSYEAFTIPGFQFRECFHRLAVWSKVFIELVVKYLKLDLRVSLFSKRKLFPRDDKAKLVFLPLNHKSLRLKQLFALPKLL